MVVERKDTDQISFDLSNQPVFSSIPESIKYVSDPCENCSRVRVELLTDDDLVCEKCYWSQVKHDYRYDLREYWG